MAYRSYPMPKVRGDGQEELPHARGQGQRPREATPFLRPGAAAGRSNPTLEVRGGCAGAGGPRRATLHSRSGGAALMRYPLSKVRGSSCTLL